jgi:hypothetical protein
MRQNYNVEYTIEGMNGYHMMMVQAYHPSEACDIVKAMMPRAHVFHALLVG